MENYKLVLPEDLNHYGYLFGGSLLKWVDEYAWIAASLEYPEYKFVTIGFDNVEFKRSVKAGDILKFIIERDRIGDTSISYHVKVFQDNNPILTKNLIFSTCITFVCIDDKGKKKSLSISGRMV